MFEEHNHVDFSNPNPKSSNFTANNTKSPDKTRQISGHPTQAQGQQRGRYLDALTTGFTLHVFRFSRINYLRVTNKGPVISFSPTPRLQQPTHLRPRPRYPD
ncbi:hypothetical protein VTI74DRAFT_1653 [Chaetomium olivicolor]